MNVLPVGEREALRSSGTPGEKMFQSNVPRITSGNGVDGLKALMREHNASTFKYNVADDRLYVYFSSTANATKAYSFFSLYKTLIGNLNIHQSSTTGFRIDKASRFVRAQKVEAVAKPQTFDEFVQGVKDAFNAFRSGTTSLTYKVDKTARRVYAYAASNRKNGTAFEAAKIKIAATHKFHTVNSGEYNVALRFDFDQKAEVGYNTLIKGLEETIPEAPAKAETLVSLSRELTDPASKLEGLVPRETLEQVRRILAGERLPKPVPKPRFETQGKTELKLFVSAGKELDIAAQVVALNQTGKDTAVFTYGQIGYVYFGSKTIHNPTVVLMRDYANPKAVYVIVRTAAGYHLHTHIKQV
ncbi:hypothetical protein D3C75_740020 [compost metagenome]